MRERIAGGYDDFVLPFMIGMGFIIIYLIIALIRLFRHMPQPDRITVRATRRIITKIKLLFFIQQFSFS